MTLKNETSFYVKFTHRNYHFHYIFLKWINFVRIIQGKWTIIFTKAYSGPFTPKPGYWVYNERTLTRCFVLNVVKMKYA